MDSSFKPAGGADLKCDFISQCVPDVSSNRRLSINSNEELFYMMPTGLVSKPPVTKTQTTNLTTIYLLILYDVIFYRKWWFYSIVVLCVPMLECVCVCVLKRPVWAHRWKHYSSMEQKHLVISINGTVRVIFPQKTNQNKTTKSFFHTTKKQNKTVLQHLPAAMLEKEKIFCFLKL